MQRSLVNLIRERTRPLFKKRAIPGWFLFCWKGIGLASNLDFLQSKGRALLEFLQAHDWACFIAGLVWLSVLALRRSGAQFGSIDAFPMDIVQISEIRFDFLPDSPLQHGWVLAYEDPRDPVSFSAPLETFAEGGLSMSVNRKYAIDLPIHKPDDLSDMLRFAVRYSESAMIFTQFEATSDNGKRKELLWIKYYLGSSAPSFDDSYPNECTVWVKGRHLGGGWVWLELRLLDVVKQSWGRKGWVYGSLTKIRLRGSCSVSTIRLFKSEDSNRI